MMRLKWWLVERILGRKTSAAVLATLDGAMDDLASMVSDPAMHVAVDDLRACAAIRRNMIEVEKILVLRNGRTYDEFYDETWWLARWENV